MLAYINLFLCGLLFGLLFVESGSIWMVAALHSGWNFLQGNIFGISVSGTAKSSSVFDSSFADGWSFMNGGDFGLEGGLAVTIVLAVGIYVAYRRMERSGMLVKRMQTEAMNAVKETVSAEQTEQVEQVVGNRPTQSSEEEGGFAQKTALNLDTLRDIEKHKEEAGVIVKEKPEAVSYPSKTVFDADYFQK